MQRDLHADADKQQQGDLCQVFETLLWNRYCHGLDKAQQSKENISFFLTTYAK